MDRLRDWLLRAERSTAGRGSRGEGSIAWYEEPRSMIELGEEC